MMSPSRERRVEQGELVQVLGQPWVRSTMIGEGHVVADHRRADGTGFAVA